MRASSAACAARCGYAATRSSALARSDNEVNMNHTPLKSQRGGAALIVTLMLFLAMALAAFAVNRHLVFEQRSAANQARATQAFEAAEAGLEWAQAQLNSTQRIGTDCQPST